MNIDFNILTQEFSKLKNSIASMIFFIYTNKTGKTAKRWININVSYLHALYKDIPYLEKTYLDYLPNKNQVQLQAVSELLMSCILSYRLKLLKELDWTFHQMKTDKSEFYITRANKLKVEIKRIDEKYKFPENVQYEHRIKSDGYGKNIIRLKNIPGIELNKKTQQIYICGTVVKEIIINGASKTTKESAEVTVEKEKIRKYMSSAKFRRFSLSNFQSGISINGNIIELK